jgi:hypothetical protein
VSAEDRLQQRPGYGSAERARVSAEDRLPQRPGYGSAERVRLSAPDGDADSLARELAMLARHMRIIARSGLASKSLAVSAACLGTGLTTWCVAGDFPGHVAPGQLSG